MAKVSAAAVLLTTAFDGRQAPGGYAPRPEFDRVRYGGEAKHAMVGGRAGEIRRSTLARRMGLALEATAGSASASALTGARW